MRWCLQKGGWWFVLRFLALLEFFLDRRVCRVAAAVAVLAAAAANGQGTARPESLPAGVIDLLRRSELEPATQQLEQWCASRADSPSRWKAAAETLLRGGHSAAAEPFAQAASQRRPRDPRLLGLWGSCILLRGELVRAEAFHRDALQRFPRDAELNFGYGMALARNQKLLEALRAFQAALRVAPKRPVYHFWTGDTLLRLSRYSAAERHLRRAQEGNEAVPDARWKLGLALFHQGRNDDAEQALISAIEELSGRARLRALYHYGVVLHELGRHSDAVQPLRSLLDAWPEHRAGWSALARSLRRIGDAAGAEQAVATYRKLQATEDDLERQHLLQQIGLPVSAGR